MLIEGPAAHNVESTEIGCLGRMPCSAKRACGAVCSAGRKGGKGERQTGQGRVLAGGEMAFAGLGVSLVSSWCLLGIDSIRQRPLQSADFRKFSGKKRGKATKFKMEIESEIEVENLSDLQKSNH